MDEAFIESIKNEAREKEKKAKYKSQRGMATKQKKQQEMLVKRSGGRSRICMIGQLKPGKQSVRS